MTETATVEFQLQQFAQGQSHLQAFFAETPDLFCRLSLDANCLELCPHWLPVTGWNPTDLQGTGWLACIASEDRPTIFQMLHQASLQTQATQPITCRFRYPDESWQFFAVRSRIHQGSYWLHCRPLGTHLPQLSQPDLQRLQRSEERWQLAIEGSNDGIWDWDIENDQVFRSERWLSILGYSKDQIDTKQEFWTNLIHPEDRKAVIAAQQAYLQHLNPEYAVEYRMRCQDGTYKWIFSRGKAVWDYQGNPIRMVGTNTDIHDRKQIKQERDRFLTQLQIQNKNLEQLIQQLGALLEDRTYQMVQQAQTLDAILSSSSDPIYCFDRHYQLRYVSIRGAAILGYAPNEMLHKTGRELGFPERSVVKFEQQIQDVITTGNSQTYQKGLVTVQGKRDFEYVLNPIFAESGEVEAVVINARDVTDLKRSEHILKNLAAGTAAVIGKDFFPALVHHLAQTLNVRYAIIAELHSHQRLEIVAASPELSTKISRAWAIANTPCQQAIAQGSYHCPCLVQQQFPEDQNLVTLEADSYYGISLTNSQGDHIGLLCVLDHKPFPYSERIEQVLRIFAARAGAELERQQTSDALHRSEERFRRIFEESPLGIALADLEGRFVTVNPKLCKWLGYSATALKQLTFFEITHIADRGLHLPYLQDLMSGQLDRISIEKRFLHKNGTPLWANLTLSRVCYSEDDSIHLLGLIEDIGDRKQAEQALKDSRHLLQQITETSPSLVYIFDLIQQATVYTNRDLAVVLGYQDRQISEASLQFLANVMHPDDFPRFISYLQQLSAATDGELLSLEYRVRKANGRWAWFESVDTVFTRDAKGTVTQVIGNALDISDRKQAEAEMEKALERERELSELKSRFVSMTSHEFRTPLAVIASSAGILKDFGYKLDESRKQRHLETIQTYVQHTTQLLDDILLLNRAESGRVNCVPLPLNLVTFCRELIEDMQLSAPDYVLNLTLEEPEVAIFEMSASWSVLLDAKLLRQILVNLLSNGIKYSDPGSCVTLSLARDDTTVTLNISDEGIGILPEDQEYLFESFHRGANVGTTQGTGLGLSIVKRCVELHNGRLSFKSRPLQGTTFTVCLPITADEVSEPVVPKAE
ncbi:PAS domain S-box protein [Almyronema epifaneia]|uniref:histidine kinase n=1 Tax=Almyronema epifaneia S1 TaxID=2991925 RepID=A0ABW6IBV1_9CYAN